MSQGDDRREVDRVPTGGALHAQLSIETEVLALSTRGMKVRLSFTPEMGSRHIFTLQLGNESIEVLALVRNTETQQRDGRPAYNVGLEFENVGVREQATLDRFVGSRLL